MKIRMFLVLALSVLLTGGMVSSGLYGQAKKKAAGLFGKPAQLIHGKPSIIPVCPAVEFRFALGAIAGNPLGTRIDVGDHFLFEVIVTSAAGGSLTWNLLVYLQNSCDGGQTWNDIACVQSSSPTTFPATYLVPISTVAAGSSAVSATSDGSLANGTCLQGPVGNLWRIKYSDFETKTYAGGMWGFEAFIHPGKKIFSEKGKPPRIYDVRTRRPIDQIPQILFRR